VATQLPRPSLTRGGGATLLKLGFVAIYVMAWSWLMIGLAGSGRLEVDAALLIVLVFVAFPPGDGAPIAERRAGIAALAAAAAWAGGATVIPLFDDFGSVWATVTAALFLLPALVVLREHETRRAEWLGQVGFFLGFAPVFIGAVLAGGVLGPLSGSLGPLWVTLGVLVLLAGSVPFAIVALWAGLSKPAAVLILVGSFTQVLAGLSGRSATSGDLLVASGALAYAAGWAWLGKRLLTTKRLEEGG